MRVVILNASEQGLFEVSVSQDLINKQIKELEANNNVIKNIIYLQCNKGYLETVVIEYDQAQNKEQQEECNNE